MPELAKAYEPQQVEDRLYEKWRQGGYFRADPKSPKEPYSIVMPPPNVTGKLTLGHVLNNTLQDILCRKARMEGKEVLWLPGTDHAGLATQTAVEKHLRNTEKKTRHDFAREEFVARVWQWKEEFGGIITRQLRKLGASCDWSRERFTMDPDYERAVQEVFVQLYNENVIYLDQRMVNWCPGSLTAISDEEVIPTKQKGFLYYIHYELIDNPGQYLEVATTRPETIIADVALAVNPNGKWQYLIDRYAYRPLDSVPIRIIGDSAVDESFGTGVLKVTPAHDKTDFEIVKRYNRQNPGEKLPILNIFTTDAKVDCRTEIDRAKNNITWSRPSPISQVANSARIQERLNELYALNGLDRFEARKKSIELLKNKGLLVKEEPYENNVGFSERAGVPIEPRLSTQWFLKYPNIDDALALLRKGHVKFYPDHWTKTYEHWLENIQDWCISRQIWWGHRIPIWYKLRDSLTSATHLRFLNQSERDIGVSTWKDYIKCSIESPGVGWIQDEDTLDTWFSSWLWAYETMRADDGTRRKFYPTSALVTGPDIIFLWVARMLIAGLHFKPNGEKGGEKETLEANLAFKDVYFTGLIRDRQGRKLSKSLGNSPDPLDLIAKYGADGLRFGLVRIAPQGADIRFDEKQIEEGRNFCNKLWNICRFRAMQGAIDPQADPFRYTRSIFADELLDRFHFLLEGDRNALDALKSYNFSEAASRLYDFVWNEFASRFVEAAKIDFAQADSSTRAGTLATFDYVMSRVLRLLHPFAPFVTEELWCELGFGPATIQFAAWPSQSPRAQEWSPRAREIYSAADAGRTLRGEVKLPSNQKVTFYLVPNYALKESPLTAEQLAVLAAFLNASAIEILDGPPVNPGPKTFTPLGEFYLPATGLVDPTLERDRLTKELARVEKDLEQTRRKLGDANMLAKAPPAKVEEWRAHETALAGKEKSLRESLKKLDE
jgi:valyl-tRNA synthetase